MDPEWNFSFVKADVWILVPGSVTLCHVGTGHQGVLVPVAYEPVKRDQRRSEAYVRSGATKARSGSSDYATPCCSHLTSVQSVVASNWRYTTECLYKVLSHGEWLEWPDRRVPKIRSSLGSDP